MTAFLKQAAAYFFREGDLTGTCFLFPNRRSLVFFKKYLGEEVVSSGRPLICPAMYTVNDFFFKAAGKEVTGRVQLLLSLYGCYKKLNPKAEPLDDFIFWGDVLLSDFDDVDKYLVDAGSLFANISDLKDIEDDFSYLSDVQRKAIRNFIHHFRDGGKLTVNLEDSSESKGGKNVKGKFLKIWNLLHPLYLNFRKELDRCGFAYEGMVYRDLAERLDSEAASDVLEGSFPGKTRFVFIGLNALNECEKKTMRKMRDAGIARFCWDYSSSMIKDPDNKASLFMGANVAEFPNAFAFDTEGLPDTEFTAISVASSVGQSKQLGHIFDRLGSGIDTRTAIVLPDENLLVPVMNSIPESIPDVNVTMGYPMGGSELHAFLRDAGALQLHLREKDGKWFFYHKYVWSLLASGILKAVLDEKDLAIASDIRKSRKYYIPEEAFGGSDMLGVVFRPVVKDNTVTDSSSSDSLADYFQDIIAVIAPRLKDRTGMDLELEFAREYYLAIGQLRQYELEIQPSTWISLLERMASSLSVPFNGEPLKGLQIMGPLETRALDFDNVIILSCNEGMFPRHSVSSSFIPHELRKGFGLPTYEFQDAVWAYYFYRLIQRASRVWMVYDSRTDIGRGGEESRYIKQLEMQFGRTVGRLCAVSPVIRDEEDVEIEKTEEHIAKIRRMKMSASTLQKYLACPAQFFYSKVEGLKEGDEVSESLNAGMLGNVFHNTMKELYEGRPVITADWLRTISKEHIKSLTGKYICEELGTFEISGRNIIYEDMILRYVTKVIERDIELIRNSGEEGLRILGLERKLDTRIDGFLFEGRIDRLDSLYPGEIRVVDYKTGQVTDNDFNIDEGNAEKVVDAIFGADVQKRPKIALQLYLYDRLVKESPRYGGERITNSIYQTNRLFSNSIENVALCGKFCDLMEERLSGLLREMTAPELHFRKTADRSICSYCDFKNICGR